MSTSPQLDALSATKQELLKLLMEKKGVAAPPVPPAIMPVATDKPLPQSYAQEGLWFLDQSLPNSPLYNIPVALRLTGPLQADTLQQALNEVARRQASLRTTFSTVKDEPVQVVAPHLTIPLPVVDLSPLLQAERDAEAERLAREEAARPFHLGQGPLFRAALLRLSANEHVLLYTIHHIVSDGWSMAVLTREIVTLYQSLAAAQPSPLPPLPVQYSDFSVWQRQHLTGDVLEKHVQYWKSQLLNIPTLNLPTDRPRPAIQTYQGRDYFFSVPAGLVKKLRALSQQENVTLFMTLLAAFQTLLHRYTGQDDIVVGSPIAGRSQVETEALVGFFMNALVLRAQTGGNPKFRDLLAQVRALCLEAYAHQDLPFEMLVQELQPRRDLSHNPLFQVLFVLQNTPQQTFELPGLTVHTLGGETTMAKFDLTLELTETGEGLQGRIEYNTDLFDESTMARLAAHWQTLLAGIVARPDQRLDDLPLLPDAERHQLLVEWNSTQAPYPQAECFPQLFEAQAARTPEAVAAEYEGQALTYGQLNWQANQLARHLQTLGVGPEVLVGLCVERSLEMLVGLLGIMKAGGAYVPLDPDYPQERLAYMLDDAKAPVLVTHESLLPLLPAHQSQVVQIDADWGRIAGYSEDNLPPAATPQNLAYVIYTSGSTGKAKGTMLAHQGLVNFLHSMSREPGMTGQDSLLAVTTLSFDIAALELFLPLLVGARSLIVSRRVSTDGAELLRALNTTGATVMQATPATWRMLLEAGWTNTPALKILCGGEALAPDLRDALLERGASLWNLYGPTETTIWSTLCPITSASDPITIGRPIANTQVYLLDGRGQPVPVGVPGELFLGGDGLARGYLNRPDLTAARFTPHPFSAEPGARLYRTGDLARYRADGTIEYLGRLDFQVKIRGFRVELGEIEAALLLHPAVQEAVASAHADDTGEQRLVGYVVIREGQTASPADLRAFVVTQLPAYMVPSSFVVLDALTLTANGKVDRKALPAPNASHAESDETYIAPRTPDEEILAVIWSQVLGLERVGVKDDFFDLGGHSLLAVRMLAKVKKICGKDLPLRVLFQGATIEHLARVLSEELDTYTMPTLIEIQGGGSLPPLFCVSAPEVPALGYIFLARSVGPEQPLYALQTHYRKPGEMPYTPQDYAALAARYVEAVQEVDPNGPYYLTGMCVGASLAFEMTRQLQEQGKEVALLAILDSWPMEVLEEKPIYALHRLRPRRIRREFGFLLKKGPRGFKAVVVQKSKQIVQRLAKLILPRTAYERLYSTPEWKPQAIGSRIQSVPHTGAGILAQA